MSDLVERLRENASYHSAESSLDKTDFITWEAADEIEMLRRDRDSWKKLAELGAAKAGEA
jgi:hypothetical protein